MLSSLVSLALLQMIAVSMPGQDFFLILIANIKSGKKAGFISVLGITVGVLLLSLVVVFLLDYMIDSFNRFYPFVAIFGACFLFHLGYKIIFNRDMKIDINDEMTSESSSNFFLMDFCAMYRTKSYYIFYKYIANVF